MRRFDTHYRLGDEDRAVPETFNAITHDMDNRVHALEELRGEILELRDTVLYQAAQRIDEFIIPGLESLRLIQSGGFLVAEIADETAVSFIEGSGSLAVDESYREIFRPTPFVAMVREGSPDDWAIAQVLDYIEETGVLSYDIVAVSGDAGPWQDVIVSATAGSVMAQIEYLSAARQARDLAADWAEKPDGQDVDGAGTRSAKHHAGVASAAASTATGAASIATTKAGEALGHADDAAAWAEGTTPGGPGTKSAKEHALDAAQSALDAAQFDPASYYTKTELDDPATGKADKSELFSGDYDDLDNKPEAASETAPGLVELATVAESETGTDTERAVTPAGVAAAIAALSGGAVLPSNIVVATKTDTASRTSDTFANVSGLSVTITPSSATSRILVFAVPYVGATAGTAAFFRLLRGSTAILQGDTAGSRIQAHGTALGATSLAGVMAPVPLLAIDNPATTSAVTYNVSWASSVDTSVIYINRTSTDTDNANFSRAASILVAMEIGAAP